MALRIEDFPLKPWEVRAIAVRAEHQVDSPKALGLPKEGIGVLPDDLTLAGDLKEPPRHPLTDESIAIGKPLGAADKVAEKLPPWSRLVCPYDAVRCRVHLDDARLRAR